jgi:hypothetical protein
MYRKATVSLGSERKETDSGLECRYDSPNVIAVTVFLSPLWCVNNEDR